MTTQVKLIAVLVAILALLLGAWAIDAAGHKRGVEEVRSEVSAKAIAAQTAADALHNTQVNQVLEAQHAQQTNLQRTRADSVAAHHQLVGLHNAAAAASSDNLPTTCSDACRKHSAALADVFEQCASQLVDVADKADGHAADSLMYQQAWPKNGQ